MSQFQSLLTHRYCKTFFSARSCLDNPPTKGRFPFSKKKTTKQKNSVMEDHERSRIKHSAQSPLPRDECWAWKLRRGGRRRSCLYENKQQPLWSYLCIRCGSFTGAIYKTIKNTAATPAGWGVVHQTACCGEIIEPAGISWQWSAAGHVAGDAEMLMLPCTPIHNAWEPRIKAGCCLFF